MERPYYRKQVQLPIIECGAKDAPFIRSEGTASDKLYYAHFREEDGQYQSVLEHSQNTADRKSVV